MAKIDSVIEEKVKYALQSAYKDKSKNSPNCKGYVAAFQDNIIKGVKEVEIAKELSFGKNSKVECQFRAIHSSLAMAVNNFAPFRAHLENLILPIGEDYKTLEFEKKCPIWNKEKVGAAQPDVLITGSTEIIAIESKLKEILNPHNKCFKPRYFKELNSSQKDSKYFQEMLDIKCKAISYERFNSVQLIKHAFGLINSFPDQPVTLIYLYWEPSNVEELPKKWKDVFVGHRREIEIFEE